MAAVCLYCVVLAMIAVVSISAAAGLPRPPERLKEEVFERTLHIDPLNPSSSRYAYLPFEVPLGCGRIKVGYEYDRTRNTVDLGLFDSRATPSVESMMGFRGWSGGRRAEVMISRNEATPGYLPGDIPAGAWRVIFGLYKISPDGADLKVRITIETGPSTEAAVNGANNPDNNAGAVQVRTTNFAPSLPSVRGMKWFHGDLHMHTVHSDGDWTVDELATTASGMNLDFIVVTDHNTMSHHRDIESRMARARNPLLIRGEEVTTYGGHANAWGLPSGKVLDFRLTPGDVNGIAAIASDAHQQGALISINHPFALCGGCNWTYPSKLDSFDSIEVWNGAWDLTDEHSLRWWDELLRAGRRITAVGSSDSHRPSNLLAVPTTHVLAASLTERQLLDGIKSGRVFVTATPEMNELEFSAKTLGGSRHYMIGEEVPATRGGKVRLSFRAGGIEAGSSVSLISNAGTIRRFQPVSSVIEESIDFQCADTCFYRLEIRSKDNQMTAFTNPIYVKVQ